MRQMINVAMVKLACEWLLADERRARFRVSGGFKFSLILLEGEGSTEQVPNLFLKSLNIITLVYLYITKYNLFVCVSTDIGSGTFRFEITNWSKEAAWKHYPELSFIFFYNFPQKYAFWDL